MRTILITGVSTGIGRAIAEEVLETEEFYVVGSVRKKRGCCIFEWKIW